MRLSYLIIGNGNCNENDKKLFSNITKRIKNKNYVTIIRNNRTRNVKNFSTAISCCKIKVVDDIMI